VTHSDDRDLKGAFRDLREEDRRPGRAPDFGETLAQAKRRADARPRLEMAQGGSRRRLVRVGAWASAAVAAGVAALVLVGRGPSGDEEFARLVASYASETAAGGWTSPTSGLLEVPGRDLTRSLPSIGSPLRGLDPSSLPPRPSSPQEERS
jgi:hypothetical protein